VGSGTDDTAAKGTSWRARPVAGGIVRAAMVLIPALAGAICAGLIHNALPVPQGVEQTIAWWTLVVVGSTIPLILLTRLMKRLAPLTFLLDLTLVFPDKAPSRFKVARRAVKLGGRKVEPSSSEPVGPGDALALVAALSSHDKRTRGHSERVRVFTEMLAEEMRIPDDERNKLRWAALLHDIGKLTVPPEVLNKPGKPDAEEWQVLQQHPTEGMRIATPVLTMLGSWAAAIEHHHERWDGSGYPSGLAGDEIPYSARILAVTDSYEVMTAARPYKSAMPARAARGELVRSAGSHFDPAIVRSFLNISIGRLWRGIGLAALLAQLPLLGILFERGVFQRFGRDLGNVAAAGSLVVGMASLGMMGPRAPLPDRSVEPTEIVQPPDEGSPVEIQEEGRAEVANEGERPAGTDGSRSLVASAPAAEPQRENDEPNADQDRDRGEPQERPEPPPEPKPSEEPPPEDHYASGSIAAATPTSSVLGGATQREFLTSCGVPTTQGVDGWIFPVPSDTTSVPAQATISGASGAPIPYNLDAFFYASDCAPLGSLQSGAPDESGAVPAGTGYVVVNQPVGLSTQVTLAITH
jgi:putative nucleotidyltransferase with HDIG domain